MVVKYEVLLWPEPQAQNDGPAKVLGSPEGFSMLHLRPQIITPTEGNQLDTYGLFQKRKPESGFGLPFVAPPP